MYGSSACACAETVAYPLEDIRSQLRLQQSARLGLGTDCIRQDDRKRDGIATHPLCWIVDFLLAHLKYGGISESVVDSNGIHAALKPLVLRDDEVDLKTPVSFFFIFKFLHG